MVCFCFWIRTCLKTKTRTAKQRKGPQKASDSIVNLPEISSRSHWTPNFYDFSWWNHHFRPFSHGFLRLGFSYASDAVGHGEANDLRPFAGLPHLEEVATCRKSMNRDEVWNRWSPHSDVRCCCCVFFVMVCFMVYYIVCFMVYYIVYDGLLVLVFA